MSSVSATDGQVLGSRGTEVREVDGPIILLQLRACEKQPDGRLSQIERGDFLAAEQRLPLDYEELRKLAAAKLAQKSPGSLFVCRSQF